MLLGRRCVSPKSATFAHHTGSWHIANFARISFACHENNASRREQTINLHVLQHRRRCMLLQGVTSSTNSPAKSSRSLSALILDSPWLFSKVTVRTTLFFGRLCESAVDVGRWTISVVNCSTLASVLAESLPSAACSCRRWRITLLNESHSSAVGSLFTSRMLAYVRMHAGRVSVMCAGQ